VNGLKDEYAAAPGDLPQPVPLTNNARMVLEARYLNKDESGICTEAPQTLFRRVASAIAKSEDLYTSEPAERDRWEERFFALMTSGQFLPNSPTLMNAGREMGMLSACFVLPVEDSIDGIFDSIKHTALIQKAGGGTGFAFDELRPTGDYIRSSGGTTSGPISFWRAFSEATNAIQQGAFRRGANMGMMYIHHPDILKFLYAKEDLQQFTNYNISVKITDTWVAGLTADPDSPHVVRNPRTGKAYFLPKPLDLANYSIHDLISADPYVEPVPDDPQLRYITTPRLIAAVPADLARRVYTRRQVWQIIVRNAWRTGEPGVAFIDRINAANPTPHVGRIEATNPCGEQPLLPYEACNLGSINLGAFVRHPLAPQADIDWQSLRRAVHWAVRFLDDVIDANRYPLPEIDAVCKANRKIGLGVMGFADALYKLGVRYDSEEGLAWGERLMAFVNEEAHAYSEWLAVERGCFPNWKGSIWDTRYHRAMRNAAVSTVAPTGTISILADCSSGIEPLFSLVFFRNVLKGHKNGERPLLEVNQAFRQVAVERGFFSEGMMERVAREGTLADISDVPADVKNVFVCAHDIRPEWHVRMQAAFQRHCDSSISKTINFPHEATEADVETIYRLAFELGCKGVTVYRDGCRQEQPMALSESDVRHAPAVAPEACRYDDAESLMHGGEEPARAEATLEPAPVPEVACGIRIRQLTPFGNIHLLLTVDPRSGRELEVFAQLGKSGDVAASDLEAICRLISLWLRSGGSLEHVIQQLQGIGSNLQVPTREGRIASLADALARAFTRYLNAKEQLGLRRLLLGELDAANPAGTSRPPNGRPTNPNGNGQGAKGRGTLATDRLERGPKGLREPKSAMADRIQRHGGSEGVVACAVATTPPPSVQSFSASAVRFKLKCPECGHDLSNAEGCVKCMACGYAHC
jgi:ribonucleoside-diphosphate reductase alpha chain